MATKAPAKKPSGFGAAASKGALKSAGRLKLTGSNVNTNLSDIVTVVKNTSGKTLPFGFLPPHGVELADGETFTYNGDLRDWLNKVKRRKDAYDRAVDAKIIQVYRSVRKIVYAAVDSATAISTGDLVWLDTDDVKPASAFTWNSDLATTQEDFTAKFLGVALSDHAANSGAVTNFPVDVSEESVHVMTTDSSNWELGDYVAPAKHPSTNNLLNQKLAEAVSAGAIGRAHSRGTSATTVVARLTSAYGA